MIGEEERKHVEDSIYTVARLFGKESMHVHVSQRAFSELSEIFPEFSSYTRKGGDSMEYCFLEIRLTNVRLFVSTYAKSCSDDGLNAKGAI